MEQTIVIPTMWFVALSTIFTMILIPFLIWLAGNVVNHKTEMAVMKVSHTNLFEKLTSLVDTVQELSNKFDEYLQEDRKLMKEAIKK
jgi:hypothetical protein